MKKVVYLTAAAEDRCYREIDRSRMIGEVYGDWKAAERICEMAYKRLEPYKRVWQELPRGEWLCWLKANFGEETAQHWMYSHPVKERAKQEHPE